MKNEKLRVKIDREKLLKKGAKQVRVVVNEAKGLFNTKLEVFKDQINPQHYKGQIETFDYLADKLSQEELSGFCKGNIIKYVTREKNKGGVEDLKKASWYLNKLIESK